MGNTIGGVGVTVGADTQPESPIRPFLGRLAGFLGRQFRRVIRRLHDRLRKVRECARLLGAALESQ